MTDPPNLEDLDLSTLNEQEREALEQSFNKTSIAWPAALYCAGLKVFAILIVINAGVGDANAIAFIAIKAAGYVGFGWWARSWSRLATILLLGWHIYVSYGFIFAEGLFPKLSFWIPALIFGWAHLGAFTRHHLLSKVGPKAYEGEHP